ncbi:hypothetical protein EDD66_103405 [Mobilisporobacter senegalensis]|uniref:Uncharacterized protein n=1 Tax=Mobilisporobacter senegalensis TaxID=1329262 RepID=A0A3N1XX11_9FIRM|nr:hypothetical protein [Mobilisporobacter senegalensis]ROR29467.1 hypothetical protein EDD66_103405 [Mobilisporobacter senegalensis]
MGKCKNCNTEISDDQVLCDNCNSKESYLDELLNSVVSTQSENTENTKTMTQRRLKKRSKDSLNESSEQMVHDKLNQNIPENSESEKAEKMEKREADNLQDLMNMESIDMDPASIATDDMSIADMGPITMEQFEDVMLDESSENEEQEDEAFDMNNIFDFMDAVGDNSESVDWPSDNDEHMDDAAMSDSHDGNMGNDLGNSFENISILGSESDNNQDTEDNHEETAENPQNDTSFLSLEDDILTEDSENINELLDFLSNEDNAATLAESNGVDNDLGKSVDDDILSLDSLSSENADIGLDFGSDIGDVFSDTLDTVGTLEDLAVNDVPSVEIPGIGKEDTIKKVKEKEKKRSIFKELMFGPEEDDLEREAIEEEKKKIRKAKNKAKNKAKRASEDEENNEKKGFLSFLKKKKGNNTEKKVKKVVKPKKSKKEEIEEVDLGKINKYATMIIFSIFVALAIVIISGTEIISYSSSITKASTEFQRQRYNYAYDALSGVEVKDKDMELYDKVMTVMYVNKQLNSYNSFYSMGAYPQALDSLVKGLNRYDKYIDLAKELGIETDLNYVRDQILSELKNSYQLSEEEALDILKSEDQTTYSKKVYDAAQKGKE